MAITYSIKKEINMTDFEKALAKTYFETYTSAVQFAKNEANKKGFEVCENDWFNQVTTGMGKPSDGETTRHSIRLFKGDKEQRKTLNIQVYGMTTSFELNFYIS
jgi:hypothetical protein